MLTKALLLLGILSFNLIPPMHAADSKFPTLVVGGGCFWCTDAAFRLLPGVKNVTCGYAGGSVKNPDYEDVCSGSTGHAEVVRIEYDPAIVTVEKLLLYFFVSHDPTTMNAQGADKGTQYRSIILYANAEQRAAAEAVKAEVQKQFKEPVVTEIVALKEFWPAEDYHQDYFAKNPSRAYCQAVIRPKIEKLKKMTAPKK